jgi:dCMP deaminase
MKILNGMRIKTKWVKAYMDVASRFSELSHAKRLKVGALIVKDNRIISIGYNGTPAGWDNRCETEENTTKEEVIHAEMNCIQKLAKSHDSGYNSVMFITHSPCIACAKAIHGSGITEVYYKNVYRDTAGLNFLEKCQIPTYQIK